MGLACYVTAVTLQPGAELPATDVVLGTKNPAIVELDPNFGYWYGFDWLHIWASELYEELQGTAEDLNEVSVELTADAIAELDRLFTEKGLIPAHYAIWKDEPAVASLQALGEFIPRAKEALNQGQKLYFSSWY